MAGLPTFDDIVQTHAEFRDHIADVIHGDVEITAPAAFALVFMKSTSYCFNTFKAIGLLLPEFYYEQANALVRILWEAAANLQWVAQEPSSRARLYAQFTVVEHRKFIQMRVNENQRLGFPQAAAKYAAELREFDEAFAAVLAEYRTADKKRTRFRARFSSPTLEDVVKDIGEPWLMEYRERYPLWCFYAHASPGAVLFPNPVLREVTKEAFEEYDQPRTALVALWSMAIMERVHSLSCSVTGKRDEEYFDDLDSRLHYRRTMRHPDVPE
jgi:hypothetical protein